MPAHGITQTSFACGSVVKETLVVRMHWAALLTLSELLSQSRIRYRETPKNGVFFSAPGMGAGLRVGAPNGEGSSSR